MSAIDVMSGESVNRQLLDEALALTRADDDAPRTTVERIRIEDAFLTHFVAESEGFETTPATVLDAVRDFILE